MIDFWNTHKQVIIYAIVVIGTVLLLRLLTKLLNNWLEKRSRKRYPNEEPTTINLTHKILNALWIVLGIMALAFIFIDKDQFKLARENFYLVLYLGVVAVVTLVAVSLVQTWFKRSIKEKIDENEDITSYKFLRYIAIFGVYFIGALLILVAFESMRTFAVTALGGAGVLAVVAGVASQEALSNLVGGLFIIAFKPFKLGDIIKLDETMVGTVSDITLRHTVIRNYENKMIVIPNAIINKEKLINYDLGERMCCQWIEIGISYDSDMDLAKHIMREECEDHPNLIDNRSELDKYNDVKKVVIRVIGLNDSEVTLRAWAWASNFSDAFVMKCDLYESIKKRFDKEGIEIPFPHRTLVFKENQLKVFKENAILHETIGETNKQ
ncbi:MULTISPECIES: mechanosensitive ion channel family protein [Bizionia]|uniref:Mechanosensitive ion channel family protein n=1 Tax=Bizionia algoritergicola TaxID=291187 RepID=A0A5D0R0J5_9FLAO|nr:MULTISPECIES: mechanosensitive ion channel family protein [Bizionia]OBX22489.1 mechanosensitive ion channel protein MscS [Bizionia sp. APA-3]TYB74609.1 mechanosensitive ion channel family protein [Bizionia algoritergicola]